MRLNGDVILQSTISEEDGGSGALAAVLALFAGFALVAIVGFAPTMEIHNAAHDTRHALSFPCH